MCLRSVSYTHLAGELAAKLHTEYGVMAGDIADCLMKDYDEKESVKK